MPNDERVIGCYVPGSGVTEVRLHKGPLARRGNPDWHCSDMACLLRGDNPVGKLFRVRLGNKEVSMHGVIRCDITRTPVNK
jgi:hypothetical protein